MALDVETVYRAVVQTLIDATATIAGSLTTDEVRTIRRGNPMALPIDLTGYPAIAVQLLRESESFAQIGQRNNDHELEFAITPVMNLPMTVDVGQEGETSAEQADREIRTMAKNIKAALKANITLSGTAYWSLPESVDYFPAEIKGTFVPAATILFRTKHRST